MKREKDMKLIFQSYGGTIYHMTPANQAHSKIRNVLLTVSDIHNYGLKEYAEVTGKKGRNFLGLDGY